jgi:hypothetical protein
MTARAMTVNRHHTLGTTPFNDGTKSPSTLGGQGIAKSWSNST